MTNLRHESRCRKLSCRQNRKEEGGEEREREISVDDNKRAYEVIKNGENVYLRRKEVAKAFATTQPADCKMFSHDEVGSSPNGPN